MKEFEILKEKMQRFINFALSDEDSSDEVKNKLEELAFSFMNYEMKIRYKEQVKTDFGEAARLSLPRIKTPLSNLQRN